jgi:cell division protein FtsQ
MSVGRDFDEEEIPRSRLTWPWVALLGAVAAAALALHSPLLAVSRIEVVGAVESSAVARVAASGVGEGALLLWVDTEAVRRAVAEDPWVSHVAVERVWPNRLVVEVFERRPVVWIEGTTVWMRVATDGVVIDVAERPIPGLVQAAVAMPDRSPGEKPTDPVWGELVALALVLTDGIGSDIRVELRGAELWSDVREIEVRLGHPIDLADKARTLVALLREPLEPGSRIDVTSPQRPAIYPPDDPQSDIEG